MYKASARQVLSMDFHQLLRTRHLDADNANQLLGALALAQGQEFKQDYKDMSIAEFLCWAGDVSQEVLNCSINDGVFRFQVFFGEGILTDGRRFILDVNSTTNIRRSYATCDTETRRGFSGSPTKLSDIPESVLESLASDQLPGPQVQALWLVNEVARLGIDFNARAAA